MPYFTKKGTGKDKGKTCVHKKSSKKKVGCTSGPIEKYLTALRMAESDDMGWIHSTGQNKILTINKLKELFKKNNIDVDWDIEYDRSADGHGEYNEYFGKFYYDRENPISYNESNESYFIELYEKENGHLFFQLYRYDEEDDEYYRDDVYSQIETSSKNPEKFWRTVGWLVLYQMGKVNTGSGEETFDVENTIEESDDMSWVRDTTPKFTAELLEPGQKFYDKWGDVTRVLEYMGRDKENICYEPPCTLLNFRKLKDPSGYHPFPGVPMNHPLNTDMIFIPSEFDNYIDTGKLTPIFGDLNESEELDWIKKQEPEKEMKKNKRYAIDVGHLRPDTPISISPTSHNYADLTKQDILNKLGNLGYDVEGIDVDSAKYFFVEPSEDAGYWDDAVWVSQGYWVDYDEEGVEDPTYNGKYEMIDVDEFMFLVDNNLISESTDFDWVRDVPLIMNVCEAYGVLKVGDEIIIDEIESWEDNHNTWEENGDIQTLHNVKAKVLALDECDKIHRTNESKHNTILVSIEEDGYYGFDDNWVRDFIGTLPSQCQKENCMFLICDTNEPEYQIQISEPSLNESNDLKWIEDIKPSWLHVGQKFTNINNVRISRRYEPKDKVQVGSMTFEIYDINHKHGEPHLRFTHNDVMDGRNWELEKEKEISQNYGGTKFTQAKHNIDTGFWIPLTDCEFITPPPLVGKTKPDGSPYGYTYCKPNMSFGGYLHESNDFDWTDEIPSDYYPPDVKDAIQKLQYWQGDAYQTYDEIGLSVQDVIDNPNKTNIQDLIDVLKHWKPYVDGDDVYWAVEDLISSINPERFKDLNNLPLSESKKTINEAAGISFEARKWGEIIYNEMINNPNEKKRLIIDGYDHPEAFDGFPIDYVVIDFYDKLTGYGQKYSGYDKDGNYVVLLYVQPKLLQGQGGYSLKSVLNHEMKHAWDDYNRLSKGLPSIDNTKETKELYNKDFILMLSDQNVQGPIKEVLKYYYYLSKLETTAYLENVYDENPVYEKIVREIVSKDFEPFKERFDLDVNWHLMNTAYNIPLLKKFKSPKEFIDYSSEELRSRAIKMIKKINKMKYVHGKL